MGLGLESVVRVRVGVRIRVGLGCGTCAQEVSHQRRQRWGGGAVPCDIGFGREQAVGLGEV